LLLVLCAVPPTAALQILSGDFDGAQKKTAVHANAAIKKGSLGCLF
jgi:hypothetical protein